MTDKQNKNPVSRLIKKKRERENHQYHEEVICATDSTDILKMIKIIWTALCQQMWKFRQNGKMSLKNKTHKRWHNNNEKIWIVI